MYERLKWLHKINPCDVDAIPFFAAIGKALQRMASYCPCCNTARVFIAAIAASIAPGLTFAVLAVWFIGALTRGEDE